MSDTLGDRLKLYENKDRLMRMVPAIARLDGKNFHRFTRDMERPFDPKFSALMIDTTKFLVEYTNANMGYTQSDEITLTWLQEREESSIFMDGRVQKMVSVLASLCTGYFNAGKISDQLAFFDCRVFAVPTIEEGANEFLWRELDATKNSISMAASTYFSHKSLMGLTSKERQEKLWAEKGINWNDYPDFFKRGTYVQRRKVTRKFTSEELENLPPKHEAHKNPALEIQRNEISIVYLPPALKILNFEEVIYYGKEPELK